MSISGRILLTLVGLLIFRRAHAADPGPDFVALHAQTDTTFKPSPNPPVMAEEPKPEEPEVPLSPPAPVVASSQVTPIALSQARKSERDHPTARRLFVSLEGHASLLSDAANLSLVNVTFGPTLRAGYRFHGTNGRAVGLILQIEQNFWRAIEGSERVVQGALNIGVGGELLFADGLVRSSVVVGPSILCFDTLLDHAGTTGFFVDIRPVGLRLHLFGGLYITVDPLSFAVVAPALGGIPLILPEYRTTVGFEGSL